MVSNLHAATGCSTHAEVAVVVGRTCCFMLLHALVRVACHLDELLAKMTNASLLHGIGMTDPGSCVDVDDSDWQLDIAGGQALV